MRRKGLTVSREEHSWKKNIDTTILEHNFELIQCEADPCLCEHGPKYESESPVVNDPWTMLLCDGCGSNGIHMHCAGMKKLPECDWLCQPCYSGAGIDVELGDGGGGGGGGGSVNLF